MIIIYVVSGLIVWCLAAHCIFLPFCTCLKRPHKIRLGALSKNKKGWPLNGAHRGGSCEKPENTTEAFKHAMGSGMNLMECDVHLSRDGEVVVAHDSDL
jgi:glycerophosphoryl diester phosphodiesterase